MADLQDAVVASSIFAVVVLTRAGNWPTAGEGLRFAVRILKTFLVGFAAAAGVSLLVLPRTCRGIVFRDVRGFVAEAEAVMEALERLVASASRSSFLTRQRTRLTEEGVEEDDEEGFAGARAHLARASGTLDGLEAKLRADLKYARNEVAWGKLSAADLDEVAVLLRGLLLPLSGMSLLPSIVDGLAGTDEQDEAAAARSGRASSSSTAREEEEDEDEEAPINGSIDALAQCLGDTRVMVGVGMQFFLRRLELADEGSTGRRLDVEAATTPAGLDVSSPEFVPLFRLRVGEMAAAKEKLRADGFVVRGSGSGADDDDMAVHRDLLLVLYLFNLQAMILDATLDLIVFADKKTSEGTMSHSHLIHPPFPSFSPFNPQPTTPLGTPIPPSTNQNICGIQVIDPVHLSPTTPLERSSSAALRPLARLVGSDLSKFGLRVAAASMSIGVVAFLHASHAWFVTQRGVWGMIVVVIGMGPTTGQSFLGFFMRIAATAVALSLSFVAWYVVGGRTPGVVVFLFVANVIEVRISTV